MAVSVRLDQGQINALLRSPSGMVAREMLRRGKRVEAVAKRLVQVDSGLTRSKINTEPVMHRGAPAARVGVRLRKARWLHDGTGLYGPHHRRIYPTTKKALAFKIGGRKIIVRSVKGMKGSKFLTRALPAAGG